jgi:solute carrier family 66 (lysosomal lysine-arginine transporter), member 1
MFPPQQSIQVDLAALSGICGSISIACWVVVFSPQIIENFRRSSAEGLSITFLVIWLMGDVFNILGAILQGVLPTMIILAIYYTLADIVLILQVFYYRGFTLSDTPKSSSNGHVTPDHERQPLLQPDTRTAPASRDEPVAPDYHRRNSASEIRRHLSQVDGTHLSPATPLHDVPKDIYEPTLRNAKPTSILQKILFNLVAILLVCAAGVFGWWLSTRAAHHKRHREHHHHHHAPTDEEPPEQLTYDLWGQFFGYLCAAFYLGSRVPQLILNYRRKSTEGVSLLFFLFACIGNLTYDMSIFAYDPNPLCFEGGAVGLCGQGEAQRIYAKYLAVNASWIAGSLGTLFLDMAIFVQFFLYRKDEDEVENEVQDGDALVD